MPEDNKPTQYYLFSVERLMSVPVPGEPNLRCAVCSSFKGIITKEEVEDPSFQERILGVLAGFPPPSNPDAQPMVLVEANAYANAMIGMEMEPDTLTSNLMPDDAPPMNKRN